MFSKVFSSFRVMVSIFASIVTVFAFVVVSPNFASADNSGDLYRTPGRHDVNGRQWQTWCEDYSSTVQRCFTEIVSGGKWVHNNLTYLPISRSAWGKNPLANNGSWVSAGYNWRTECDTAVTGRNGCRSYIKKGSSWVFNNIVLFGDSVRVDTNWRPAGKMPQVKPTPKPTISTPPIVQPVPSPTRTVVSPSPTSNPTATVTIPMPTATATSTPTQSPTSTSVPTTTNTPTITPSPTVHPSFDGFPDENNTGVPEGVTLTPSSGINVTTPGAVVSGLDVNGAINIKANNVTIRNSKIATSSRYPILVEAGVTNVTIENVEISNNGGSGKGILFRSGSSGVVRYSDIHSAEDGIHILTGNVTIEYNYIHDMTRNDGAHPDTIQIRSGDNITIRGNSLHAYSEQYGRSNASIQIGSLAGDDRISNLLVENNYMNGGNVTVNGGGRGEIESALYRGNRFGRDFLYSVRGNIENTIWENTNVYHDTGQPAS